MIEKLIAAIPDGNPDCCCHRIDEPCQFGDVVYEGRHDHKCMPRAYDLGGHCPDDGCPGRCWERQA